MGKWDKILGKLEKFGGNDKSYQDRVTQLKNKLLAPEIAIANVSTFREKMYVEAGEKIDDAIADIVEYLKNVVQKKYAATYITGYRDARLMKEALEEHIKTLNLFLEAYVQLGVNQLEVEGVTSIKLDDGSSARSQPEPFTTVEDRDLYRDWCLNTCQICSRKRHEHTTDGNCESCGKPESDHTEDWAEFCRHCGRHRTEHVLDQVDTDQVDTEPTRVLCNPDWEDTEFAPHVFYRHEFTSYEREMSLAWQTTNAIAKGRLEDGEPLPPGLKVWSKDKIVFTKAK